MIDKNSSVPMYRQIADALKADIVAGKYDANGNLGTHTQLAENYGVSLITIRKAMKILEDEQLVDVKQGKGTFVRNNIPQDTLNSLTGISNILSSQHILSQQEVKTFEFIPVPKRLDEDVRAGLGERCLHIERVHTVEQSPAAYADIYLPISFGKFFTKADVEKGTIYQIYKNKLHIELGNGRQIISAAPASRKVAKWLQVSQPSPVLLAQRRAYSRDGQLIEYMEMYYEYRHYSFEIQQRLSAD